MKKVVSIIVAIVSLLTVTFAYTFKIDDGKAQITDEVGTGKTVFVELKKGKSYVVKEGNVTLTPVSGNLEMYQFTMPESNVHISLVDAAIYTVDFNSNGGSEVDSIEVTHGHIYGTLSTPTKSGYTFAGWYKDEGLTTKVSEADTVTESHMLYAKWTGISYTVTYNANGGSGTMSASTHTYGTAKNLTASAFTRSGYTFNGWNTATDGSGTSYANKASVKNLTTTAGGNINLYAQWKVSGAPAYSYTGSASKSKDSSYWYITFTSGGTFKFTSESPKVDVFMVGGGGRGGGLGGYGSGGYHSGGGGGGGGYRKTATGVSLSAGTSYTIKIGAGSSSSSNGGTTSGFGYSANGGSSGSGRSAGGGGAAGGTGGQGWNPNGEYDRDYREDDSDGTNGRAGGYAFGSSSYAKYGAGGGGGGASTCNSGSGGDSSAANGGYSAPANRGGGGGGAQDGINRGANGSGGSGIVIIRGKF